MKPQRLPTLEERISELRAEIEAIIDARAAAVAKGSPGVPVDVVRNLLTARAPACPCSQYLGLDSEKPLVRQAQASR
jgi:hypothetical protein